MALPRSSAVRVLAVPSVLLGFPHEFLSAPRILRQVGYPGVLQPSGMGGPQRNGFGAALNRDAQIPAIIDAIEQHQTRPKS
jgi:hypothetical protein